MFAGAVKVTDAEAFPAVAVPIVGASGFFSGLKNAEINPAGYRMDMVSP
jgi:hypothetical protein